MSNNAPSHYIIYSKTFLSLFSSIHAIGAVILSLFSMAGLLRETYVCLFSGTYFLLDLVVEIYHERILFIAHHIFALLAFMYQCFNPAMIGTYSACKGLMCEISTPLFHLNNLYPNGEFREIFKKTFICVRLIWFPIVLIWNNLKYEHYPATGTAIGTLFWISNIAWYMNNLSYKAKKRLS